MVRMILRATLILVIIAAGVVLPTHTSYADGVNIRIFVGLGTGLDDNQRQVQDTLAKEWNSNNPAIQIMFDYYDDAASEKLQSQIANGNPPDIIGPVGIDGANLTDQFWEDLRPMVDKDKAELNLGDFDPATLKLFEQVSGKNLPIVLGIYPSFLWVNEDLFKDAGVPLPPKQFGAPYIDKNGKQRPWDWNTLADVARAVTSDKSGKRADETGFDAQNISIYGFGDFWLDFRNAAMRWGAVDSGVATDGKTATFNQKAFADAALWHHDAIFKGHFSPNLAAQDSITQATSPFESGKLAMWYCHSWYISSVGNATFKWGLYATPSAPAGKITAPINADTFAILSQSQHKVEAWEVFTWLTSPATSAKLCQIYGCVPARKSARAAWETRITAALPNLDLKVVYGAIPYLDTPSHEGFLPNRVQAEDAFNDFWTRLQKEPDMDVLKELDKLNQRVQAIFDGKVPASSATLEATSAP